MAAALAAGVEWVDLGSGDSGYKREMGAVPGPALIDLLIVRQREAALLLKQKWGHEPPELRPLTLASPYRSDLPLPALRHLAAMAAMADPTYAHTLFATRGGNVLLAMGVGLWLCGVMWTRRLVRVEV